MSAQVSHQKIGAARPLLRRVRLPKPRRWAVVRRAADRFGEWGLFAMALTIGVVMLGITGLLSARAWPLLADGSFLRLMASSDWHPMRGAFGLAPFLVGTAAVTAVAMGLFAPAAVLSGIYLAEYTSARSRAGFKPLVDLLAGIPPVVYGLWGILLIVPAIRDYVGPLIGGTLGRYIPWLANSNPSGYGLLAAGVVLGMMVFPVIVAVTEEVLRSVPYALRESLLAMGATKWEATKVVLKAGLPGVGAAVVLGFSRAMGETLAVMMVAGNVARIPGTIFDGVYTLPALIANNYGELMSVPLYEAALMGVALVLLVVVLVFNLGARLALLMWEGRFDDGQ